MMPLVTTARTGHPEKDYMHPGEDEHLVFDTFYGKTGMLICWGRLGSSSQLWSDERRRPRLARSISSAHDPGCRFNHRLGSYKT